MRLKTGDDSVFLCRRIRKDNRGYERFIVNLEREEYVNSAMSHLNSVYSTEKNLLSSLFVFNRKENIIAELGARLNVIHLYSVSDDFCRTVSVKNKLDNVVEKEMCVQNEMTKTYYDAKAFDSFFVGLYLGCTIKQLDDNTYSSSQLHFPNKKLYVVEDNTEKILSYDFSDIIDPISFASNLSD